ncbi:histone deacetylase complex subunit SAP130-like isoform X4 [Ptychodera flava]|uniref:histone deacetylase complex subunit SAP130-like isoform X4 n=1 Tax=Ptychodera flava TaxID=63121 RepID=UPI00396A39B9
MSSHGFQPGSGGNGEERQGEGQRPVQQQEEAKAESVVRPTTQQPPPAPPQPPHPPPAQLPPAQPVLRPPGQPVLPSVMHSQPPTETVKPYGDTLAKVLQQKTPTRPLAPAPASSISTVPKITQGHVTVMETGLSSLPGLQGQQVTTITTALALPTPIQVPATAMMKSIQASSAQVPNHPYQSHVPRVVNLTLLPSLQGLQSPAKSTQSIAAAAAMSSIPKAGATTAILRPHTQTIGAVTASTTTVQSVLSSQIIPHFQPQRYSPAPVPISTTVHTCNVQGISRSSSPAITSATTPSDIHRVGHHMPLGISSLQPRPLPTPQPQPHLQPQTQHQTLSQVPTLLQSQTQTQAPVTQASIQLPAAQFVSALRPPMAQSDLTMGRTIPLAQHITKYATPVTLPGNIPKPISATPNVTSIAISQPSQQQAVTVVSSVPTSGPPHTMSVTSIPSVLTSAPIQLGSMLATVRTSTTLAPVTVPNSSTTQSTPATATSIPVAKVYPRQQLPHSPRSQPEYDTHQPSNIYVPLAQTHRGSPNPVITAASVAATISLAQTVVTTDNRSERPVQALAQTAHYPASLPQTYFYHDPTAPYHPINPYAFTPISSGAVRPIGFNPLPVSSAPQGSQNMAAAAVAAAAHAATVGAAPVRIGPMNLMPVDQRHSMTTIPGTITATTTSEAMETSVTVSSGYPAGIISNTNTSVSSSNNLPNPSASPRPSILRKRTNEGVRKPVVNTGSQPDSPKTDSSQSTLSATSSPKPGDILNLSQHSNDVNVVDNSTNTSAVNNEIKVKREPLTPSPTDGTLQVNTTSSLVPSVASTVTMETIGASPRKKPRKQQHVVATEDHDMMESNSTDEADENDHKPPSIPRKTEKTKDDSKRTAKDIKYVQYLKRPYKNLIDAYRQPWKPAHNHFQRYAEVKVKDKKPSIQEIAGQKGVIQKASGWKIQHLASQLDDLASLEQGVFDKMKEIKEGIGPCKDNSLNSDDEMSQVAELVQGNIQRCKLAMEQMSDARHSMIKLLDHKQKVVSLLNKHTNKRSSKKKSSSST